MELFKEPLLAKSMKKFVDSWGISSMDWTLTLRRAIPVVSQNSL